MIKRFSSLPAVLLFRPDPLAGRESQAIIYAEVTKKGILTFAE